MAVVPFEGTFDVTTFTEGFDEEGFVWGAFGVGTGAALLAGVAGVALCSIGLAGVGNPACTSREGVPLGVERSLFGMRC